MNLVLFFLLGAIIGSFLNVVILRLHTGRSLEGRSHCMSCGKGLGVIDLIPVISYLSLRGRCRQCGSRFSGRYAFVEGVTGALFALTAFSEPSLVLLMAKLAIVSLLVVIFFYDLAHLIIPDELSAALVLPAVVLHMWDPVTGVLILPSLGTFLGGAVVFLFFYGLWKVSNGRWIGLGDAKLAAPLAIAVGGSLALSFVILAFWIGAVVSLLMLGLGSLLARVGGTTRLSFLPFRLTIKSEIPFAPFLIVSYFFVTLLHVDVFALTSTYLSTLLF